MDFTIRTYLKLINALIKEDYSFLTFKEYLSNPPSRSVILRHDVDRKLESSLQLSKILNKLNIHGTYYFRAVRQGINETIINEISRMGHEIGYHYEDVGTTAQRLRGSKAGRGEEHEKELVDIAIESFAKNLEKLRKIVPVFTICMHGSPMSRWDSRLLWKYYDYHNFGLIGEPYFDIDFNKVLYLTDTGRRWDGKFVSIRDKAPSSGLMARSEDHYKDWKVKPYNFRQDIYNISISSSSTSSASEALVTEALPLLLSQYKLHSTSDIIRAAKEKRLPDNLMINFHPQRWTANTFLWARELIWQNTKNIAKAIMIEQNLFTN